MAEHVFQSLYELLKRHLRDETVLSQSGQIGILQ